jgi:hypothetical protein
MGAGTARRAWGYARAGVRYGSLRTCWKARASCSAVLLPTAGLPGASEAVPPSAPEWLERGFHRRLEPTA